MPKRQFDTQAGKPSGASHLSREERKQRVLKGKAPSIVRSIANAVVIKSEDLYFLAEPDGNVSLNEGHGFGLYYHDCRYLNGYTLTINGTRPNVLASIATEGFRSVFELSNPELAAQDGKAIAKEMLGITWSRLLAHEDRALHDRIEVRNYDNRDHDLRLAVAFESHFEDIFTVRGLLPEQVGKLLEPHWQDDSLSQIYQGADGLNRSLTIHFTPPPSRHGAKHAEFDLHVPSEQSVTLEISLVLSESRHMGEVTPKPSSPPAYHQIVKSRHEDARNWAQSHAVIQSDSLLLNRILERSMSDLQILRTRLGDEEFFAAGIPWFATLFGRDSLITSMQAMAYDPTIAEQTLRLLAKFQGRQSNDWRDEQPGKILHEYRVGELACIDEIPYHPYYGSVDSTPLFLIALGEHASWTGDLRLFHDLRHSVEAALNWIDCYGDREHDGYVEYQSTSEGGLINQGWKDSGDAIVNADGSLAEPPIRMVEVQGYVYRAKSLMAELFRRSGNSGRAARLQEEARTLRERFNRDFWSDSLACYVMALQAKFRPVAVVSSNPGQALWSGICEADKAELTMKRLMADDMFSGWGIRTLSASEKRYNPIGYHLGTVWPHDNSIIAAGLRRYGFDAAAYRIFYGLFEASSYFEQYRMPELFAGFPKTLFGEPVHYPVACHPQAWAAGSLPYVMQTLLGLQAEGFEKRLRIVRPILPHFIESLEIQRLRVGNAEVDLRFSRKPDKQLDVKVLRQDGTLDVHVEQGAEQQG
ncbi:Amylo-alpha-1,6-glucosidase [compost metagenome]